MKEERVVKTETVVKCDVCKRETQSSYSLGTIDLCEVCHSDVPKWCSGKLAAHVGTAFKQRAVRYIGRSGNYHCNEVLDLIDGSLKRLGHGFWTVTVRPDCDEVWVYEHQTLEKAKSESEESYCEEYGSECEFFIIDNTLGKAYWVNFQVKAEIHELKSSE